jgi:hypothetical protein
MKNGLSILLTILCLVTSVCVVSYAHDGRFPPGVNPDNRLLAMGLLDVTKAPYSADPRGERDSTDAIQRAVKDARDYRLASFFPVGTYLISDTLSCEQENYKLDSPRFVDGRTANYWHRNHRVIMMGSTEGGKRPVLKLSDAAKGFDDPSHPKIAVRIWARTWFGDGTEEQPNISFGHFFIGIDIDIRGHSGAIGLKHSGSQGCTLQDSTIYAEGAFAGLYNCPGQAAGTYNVEVIGGDYGFYADAKSRFPILIGCRFKNQRKAAICYTKGGTQVPTLLVACLIENGSGKAIDLTTEPRYAGVSLVDCVIRMKGGTVAHTSKSENIFIENTYVSGAERISTENRKITSPDRWTLIERFSTHTNEGVNLLNGQEFSHEISEMSPIDKEPDYERILARHWRERPKFEDKETVNVRSFGAKGDGETDDTGAFQRAIDAHKIVFVPPGEYKLTGELKLRSNTQLFSLSGFLTRIGAGRAGRRREPVNGQDPFVLSTPDHPEASPGLWFLSIGGRVNWRSGKGFSMHARSRYRFTGNAGGRIHAMMAMGDQFLIEGIRNPLSFYSLNVERVTHNPQSVIDNSRGIRIYYFKVEAGTRNRGETGGGDENIPCAIKSSEDVRIYCMYGNVKGLSQDRPMLEIVDSRRIIVSQLKAFRPDVFPHIKETIGGVQHSLPSSKTCALYLRN